MTNDIKEMPKLHSGHQYSPLVVLQTLKDRETTNQPSPLPQDGELKDAAMMSDLTI